MVFHIGSTVGRESLTSLRSHGHESGWRIRAGEEDDFTEIWNEPRVLQAEVPCTRKGQRETYQDIALKIGHLNRKWTKECELVEEIRDLMNTEQLLEVLPTYLSLWIWERKLTTGVDAGKLADEYVDARKSSYGASGSTGTGRKGGLIQGENISEIWRE